MKRNNTLIINVVLFVFFSCNSAKNSQKKLIEASNNFYIESFNYGMNKINYDSLFIDKINNNRNVICYFKNLKIVKYEVWYLDTNLCCLGYNVNDSIRIAFEGVKLSDKNVLTNIVSLRINNKLNGVYIEGPQEKMKCFYKDSILWSCEKGRFKYFDENAFERTEILLKIVSGIIGQTNPSSSD
jgi:hypothetical protein